MDLTGVWPYGSFVFEGRRQIGVALDDGRVLRLAACADDLTGELAEACRAPVLNALMSRGSAAWTELRSRIPRLLREDRCINLGQADMRLPADIGDYTDFYASIHHAERVGRRFRPDNPLLPNYRHVPIAYHGRASSLVVSGTPVRRPEGQIPGSEGPHFGPTEKLDFELELGFFIGPGNELGLPIPISSAHEHIFGFVLVNDWSARDIQAWEYQPLGPFLGKSFATSISAWVIPTAALATRFIDLEHHHVLPYLEGDWRGLDLPLEVWRDGQCITRSNVRNLYWSFAQMIAHHTSNGCNLRPSDLLATGTISGATVGSEGCLLESGAPYLADGEEVVLRIPGLALADCHGRIDR